MTRTQPLPSLAARHRRVPRSGHRHPHRDQGSLSAHPKPARRDRLVRRPDRRSGRRDRARADPGRRHRPGSRRATAMHRRRQPRAVAQRGRLRDALWRRAATCQQRQDPTPQAQPRRRSRCQQRPSHGRRQPYPRRSAHQGLHRPAHHRRPVETGDHALPEALPRPRGLLPDQELETRRTRSFDKQESIRGCQYTSAQYARLAERLGARLSVARKGQCGDNTVAESFFATIKTELLDRRAWPTRAAARTAIFDWIERPRSSTRRRSRFPGSTANGWYGRPLLPLGLVQHPTPALHPRLPQPRCLRGHRLHRQTTQQGSVRSTHRPCPSNRVKPKGGPGRPTPSHEPSVGSRVATRRTAQQRLRSRRCTYRGRRTAWRVPTS